MSNRPAEPAAPSDDGWPAEPPAGNWPAAEQPPLAGSADRPPDAVATSSSGLPDRPNWIRRHPVWSGVLGLVAVGAIVIGALASTSPTSRPAALTSRAMAARQHSWLHGTGGTALDKVQTDLYQYSADAAALNYPAMLTDCEHLQAATTTALAAPRDPIPAAASHLAAAYAELHSAASACISAINNTDISEMRHALTDLSDAGTQIEDADTAVHTATGKS